jgi:hypothetical protein
MNNYSLHVDASVTGTQSVEQLGGSADKLAERTKRLNDALYGQTKATEAMSLSTAKLATEELRLEQLRERHRMQTESMANASIKAAAANEMLDVSTKKVVSSTMAATTAMKVLEGATPMKAAANFLGSLQGMGPALQAAFPLFAATAMVGVIEKIVSGVEKWYDKYVQLKEVQEEIARTAKELAASTEQSYFAVTGMEIAELRRQKKFAEAGAMETAQVASTPLGLPEFDKKKLATLDRPQVRRIEELYSPMVVGDIADRIQDAQIMQRNLRTAGLNVGSPAFESYGSEKAIKLQKDAVDGLLQFLLQRQQEFGGQVHAIQQKTQHDINQPAVEAAYASAQSANRMRKTGQTPTAAFLEQYNALLPKDRAAIAPFAQARLAEIAKKEFEGYESAGIKGGVEGGYVGAFRLFKEKLDHPSKLTLTGFDDSYDANELYRMQKEAVGVYNSAQLGRMNTQIGTMRDVAGRQGRLIAAGAGPNDELSTLRQQIALRKDAAEQEFKLKQTHSDILDIKKAELEKTKEIGDADLDYATKVLELKRKQNEEMVSMLSGFIMAVQHGGAGSYLKSQFEGIEGKVLSNLVRAGIDSPTGQSIAGKLHATDGTFLAKMLAGTPFGPDPTKTAAASTDANTVATIDNTTALRSLSLSPSGGGGGAVRWGGGGGATYDGVAGLALGGGYDNEHGGANPAWSDTPWQNSGGGGTYNGSGSGLNVSKAMRYGSAAVGAGLSLAAAATSQSTRGKLAGGGGALVSIGSVIPGPAGAAVMAAGAAISVISSLMGDPVAMKRQQIADTLRTSQFMSPVSINASMSMGGTYADMDRYGNVRNSAYSPYPSVEQGFFDYQHGVTVPGRTTSQFGGLAITVHAMDSQSFIDHSGDISDAVNHALLTGRGAPLAETISTRR